MARKKIEKKGNCPGLYTSMEEDFLRSIDPKNPFFSSISGIKQRIIDPWIKISSRHRRMAALEIRLGKNLASGKVKNKKFATDRFRRVKEEVEVFGKVQNTILKMSEVKNEIIYDVANLITPLAKLDSLRPGRSKSFNAVQKVLNDTVNQKFPANKAQLAKLTPEERLAHDQARELLDVYAPGKMKSAISSFYAFEKGKLNERSPRFLQDLMQLENEENQELQRIDRAIKRFGKWYLPNIRRQSGWVHGIVAVKGDRSITVYSDVAHSFNEAEKRDQMLQTWIKEPKNRQRMFSDFSEKFLDGESIRTFDLSDWEFKPLKVKKAPEQSKVDQVLTGVDINKVIRILERKDIDEQVRREVREELKKAYQAIGFGKHMIEREDVHGYKGDSVRREIFNDPDPDVHEILTNYGRSLGSFVSRILATQELYEIYSNHKILKEDTPNMNFLRKWTQNRMRRPTDIDRVANTIMASVSIAGIGFRTMSSFLNITQPTVFGVPEFTNTDWGGGQGVLQSWFRVWKAQVDTITDPIVKGRLTEEEKQAVDRAIRKGKIQAELTREMFAFGDTVFKSGVEGFMKVATSMMSATEIWNRESIFLAAYRIARKSNISEEQAFDKGVEANRRINFSYAPEDRPMIYDSALFKPFLSLQRFGFEAIAWNTRQIEEKNLKAFMTHMGLLFLLGGISALPFFNVFDEIWEKKYGRSFLVSLEDALAEIQIVNQTKDINPQAEFDLRDADPEESFIHPDWFTAGAFGKLSGVDISRNLSLMVPSSLEQMGGMFGSIIRDTGRFFEEIKRGEQGRAMEHFPLFPTILKQGIRVNRELEERVITTPSGRRVEFAPSRNKSTVILNFMGGKTTDQRKFNRIRRAEFTEARFAKERKRPLLDRLRRAFIKDAAKQATKGFDLDRSQIVNKKNEFALKDFDLGTDKPVIDKTEVEKVIDLITEHNQSWGDQNRRELIITVDSMRAAISSTTGRNKAIKARAIQRLSRSLPKTLR